MIIERGKMLKFIKQGVNKKCRAKRQKDTKNINKLKDKAKSKEM